MSIIHELMYGTGDFEGVDAKDYVGRLTGFLMQTYSTTSRIKLNLDIDNFSIDIESITPCGLIINEIISNSLKYAFPGDRSGAISIYMRRAAENQVEFVYADDGIGFKLPGDMKKVETLGLRLVNNLVTKQLGGTLEARSNGRTEFRIRFKLEPDPATR